VKIACVRFGLNAALGTDVVLGGGGTAASPVIDGTASPKFLSFYVKSTAASGTARGNYTRLYLTAGAGGEAGRYYTTVSSNTPADTVNGVHCSLDFGSSAGNVTGQGAAGRFTLGVPASRALTGTTGVLQADMDIATSGTLAGSHAFLRCTAMGAGAAAVDDSAFLLIMDGLTAAHGKLYIDHAPSTLGGSLKVRINGTTFYIGLYTTPGTS
jgi:hypothetical protein